MRLTSILNPIFIHVTYRDCPRGGQNVPGEQANLAYLFIITAGAIYIQLENK